MAVGLTDAAIKAAKPKDKRYTLFDTGGLYLEIAPNGSKWWRLRYRKDGRTKKISLGVYPVVSLKNAREKRDAARTLVANGGDPQDEKVTAKGRRLLPTFQSVAEEWFAVKCGTWSASNVRTIRQRLDCYLLKNIPDKPFSELTTQDFLKVLRKVEERGRLQTTHRLAQLCGQVARFARISGIITYDPVQGISEVLKPAREKHQSTITDPQEIGRLLEIINSYPGCSVTLMALRIMPYVFVRSGELRGAKWEEIDFDSASWIIPAERMKMRREHIVPLSRQAAGLFAELRRFTPGDLCFPSPVAPSQCITDVALLKRLRSLGYDRESMCIHGFRSMASTILNEQGYRPDIIEMQLAHADANHIRAAYNHARYFEERRKMMQDWADHLDTLREQYRNS
ncbi:MAG: DUF4102 domain-containing protein [Desulfovibrio desulfuricans]|nr:DUF4102 domain-containing protein [Desulfovibrio desulfuricans]